MAKLQFNETLYTFHRHRDGKIADGYKELHLFKNGELVHKQYMHVDLFELNLLTFDRCVDIIKAYENKGKYKTYPNGAMIDKQITSNLDISK